ncbi:Sterol 3-beta-glucosyltransferase UGT80A2 [Platanthera zijinensis]|uniref:Sterol 3-beta-glucosyltransferase UGT80A2 n=1 Tax=Platanthera zijinensis TaxID=2320716 RepID=A0AAP0BFW7_9ASPA
MRGVVVEDNSPRYGSPATVKDDGTVEVQVPGDIERATLDLRSDYVVSQAVDEEPMEAADLPYVPPLQIVILIVGTRGDVQPFVAIGKCLQRLHGRVSPRRKIELFRVGALRYQSHSFLPPASRSSTLAFANDKYASASTSAHPDYGHRVRLATHANFKEFVLTAGLEFYPLGGDPKVLAEYMVKNKGFLPSSPSEIPVQRKQIKEIIFSLLPACKDPDMDTGIPFKADAIIANPPAYG